MSKNIGISAEACAKRVNEMKNLRDEFINNLDSCHVKLMGGNKKTGKDCYTVSLIPVLDCPNCNLCKNTCYDVAHDCIYPQVKSSRANNSAIHLKDNDRFWKEISEEITRKKVKTLRINVGGDLSYIDYAKLNAVAGQHPETTFLFFTKNISDINRFLDEGNIFPENVRIMVSRWDGDSLDNKYKFPESHLIWYNKEYADIIKDLDANGNDINALGKTTHVSGKTFEVCSGNCSVCFDEGKGCWNAPDNSDIILIAH